MLRIGVIPLDSRPCNTLWIKQFGKMAQLEIIMYPVEKCGNLFEGANLDDMLAWLKDNHHQFDHLIISVDGLCFGGLIQARQAKIDVFEVLSKIEILKEIKKDHPDLQIDVFDTIMRTSITAYDEETAKYWNKMNEYSYYKGRCYFFNDDKDVAALKTLENEIPHYIIDTYLKARQVKSEISYYFIHLMEENIINNLIVLQEDSMPWGIQKIESTKLQEYCEANHLSSRVSIYNGTDEGGLIILASILTKNYHPKVYIHLASQRILDKVFRFEDRPFKENLYKMMDSMGLLRVEEVNQADYILSIYSEDTNYDLDLSKYEEIPLAHSKETQAYLSSLNKFLNDEKKVVLVDLMFPNGGSFELLQKIDYHKLWGYSAWNTSSNSLGSALCLCSLNGDIDFKQKSKFLYERIMDDCIYQYIVRRKVSEKLIKQNINIYNLANHASLAEEMILSMLKDYDWVINHQNYRIKLPWQRMFEIKLEIEEKVKS